MTPLDIKASVYQTIFSSPQPIGTPTISQLTDLETDQISAALYSLRKDGLVQQVRQAQVIDRNGKPGRNYWLYVPTAKADPDPASQTSEEAELPPVGEPEPIVPGPVECNTPAKTESKGCCGACYPTEPAIQPTRVLRPVAWVLAKPGEMIYDDAVTRIEIDDEGGGEFLVLKQFTARDAGEVRLDQDEIEPLIRALRTVVQHLVREAA